MDPAICQERFESNLGYIEEHSAIRRLKDLTVSLVRAQLPHTATNANDSIVLGFRCRRRLDTNMAISFYSNVLMFAFCRPFRN